MAYISNYLTHWVGRSEASDQARYALLTEKILKERELLFSACEWNFKSKYGGVQGHRIPMVCFTDIPFAEAQKHCACYSRFGLAFSKNYLANCLASPVCYVLNPFVFEAYSSLYHKIDGMRELIDGRTIAHGKHSGQAIDANRMLELLQAIAVHFESYDRAEYIFHEGHPHPVQDQEDYFSREDALYYEREWRIVERLGSGFPWDTYRDGRHYFSFEPQYLKFIIVPRAFVEPLKADKEVRRALDGPAKPSVVAYEDLNLPLH